jgi:hypothetical protein
MRIELELYAERLSRQADRLSDDVDGARMRIAWAQLEARARERLSSADMCVLDALGVFTGAEEAAERRLISRRVRQLEALRRFQALVEAELAAARAARPQRGAMQTSSPPSLS